MTTQSEIGELRHEISRYIDACKRLLGDFSDAMLTIGFRERGGTTIRAIDFTEIHSYVLPTEDIEDVSAVPVLTDVQQVALNLAMLSRIFFSFDAENFSPPPVVLLPPYRQELLGSKALISRRTFEKFVNLAAQAQRKLRIIEADDTLAHILSELPTEGAPSDEARKALIRYLNENAAELLILSTERREWSPEARLKELLNRAHLTDLDDRQTFGRALGIRKLDDDLVKSIQDEIVSLRQRGMIRRQRLSQRTGRPAQNWRREYNLRASARLDAIAAAMIIHANDRISSDNRRIVLVTRSETLIAAIDQISTRRRMGYWKEFFRRPRAYAASMLLPSETPSERRELLEQHHSALSAIVHARSQRDMTAELEDADELAKRVQDLKNLWRSASNLLVASSEWELDHISDIPDSNFRTLLEVLRSRKGEIDRIVEQAEKEVEFDLIMNNARLGQVLSTGSGEGVPLRLVGDVRGESRETGPTLVWSKSTQLTIALAFYSDIVRSAWRNRKTGDRALREFLRSTEPEAPEETSHGFELEPEEYQKPFAVESCLAFGFLAATRSDWAQALLYADMAVKWQIDIDPTPRHEAYYFRAMSRLRSGPPNLKTIAMGLEDLEAALHERRRATHNASLQDPRYIFERGVHLFKRWDFNRRAGRDLFSPPSDDGSIRMAREAFRTAKSLIEKELTGIREKSGIAQDQASEIFVRQLADIANAQCYVAIEAGSRQDDPIRTFGNFVHSMRQCGWDATTMPVSFLDTLVWAKHKLRPELTPSDRDDYILNSEVEVLASRLENEGALAGSTAAIRDHVTKIVEDMGWQLTGHLTKRSEPRGPE